MKKLNLNIIIIFILILGINLFSQIAVKGEKIHTMAGKTIENGIILIKDGKISAVGTSDEISIPADYKIVEGKVVTPGLIDARSVVGLAGIYNQPHDQDQLETSDPIQPELRAIDAYNPREELISWIRSFGVTTINTGHAPGGLSSGQTMIVKTTGNIGDDILKPVSAVVFSLGPEVSGQFKKPGSRPKGISMLRTAFLDAKNQMEKSGDDSAQRLSLRHQILADILSKKIPAIITANTSVDILAAIRLAKEFDIDIIIDGASESYHVLDEIKKSNFPVFMHAMMSRTRNLSYETPLKLKEKGISFAIQSGYESYVPKTRVILFEAAIAAANGLTFEEALASITISPAKILGIDNRVGSIETDKDADIAIYNGDPFEYTTHCCAVIINGILMEEECR